jgi:hypothetical protein
VVEALVGHGNHADAGAGAESVFKEQAGAPGVDIGGDDVERGGNRPALAEPIAQRDGGDIGAVAANFGRRDGVQGGGRRTQFLQRCPADVGVAAECLSSGMRR